jgi:hypothetical protein
MDHFILSDKLFIETYKTQMTDSQIKEVLSLKSRFQWVSYIISLLIPILRCMFVSLCILIGLTLSDVNISFKQILRIVLISEFVFITYQLVRFILLLNININSIETIQYFWPLSLLTFVDPNTMSVVNYPLQVINISQIVYLFALAFGLTKLLKYNFFRNLKIVFSSYGTGLILWIAIVVFAQLYLLNG